MGAYLDRLNQQYDEIRDGIDALVNRAAEEKRDVNDDEAKQVDRDKGRLDELATAIEHYAGLETQAGKVAEVRRSVPATPTATRTASTVVDEPYDIAREFPTVGDYAITVHRAMTMRDPAAIEKLDRATAHQKLADNPGIVPRPVLGPVLNDIDASRPFINSITRKSLPAGQFDRPVVTQHVVVDKQAAEKDLTASQKMLIGKLPVTADTFAGHLNISRQDIKWTSPGILQIVFEDFANVYANATDNEACEDFAASVVQTAPIATWDAAGIYAAIYTAAATSLGAVNALPDTLWVSPDVWGRLGGVTTNQGNALFPGMNPGGMSGSPMGFNLVVDKNFPNATMIQGPSRYAEWYEDVDGLMQVGEPDVLGQLVGYAGFGAFLNVKPEAYTKFTVPAPAVASAQSGGGRK
jgi:HK97 family phage major capsid protein